MDYQIVKREMPYEVEHEVLKLIKLGWVPQGGVSHLRANGASNYAQAMVKESTT